MKSLSLEEIPVISQKFSEKEALKKALNCYADNKKAKIFISKPNDNSFLEEKIVIVWDKKHDEFGKIFTTKYFSFSKKGILEWGHENNQIIIYK